MADSDQPPLLANVEAEQGLLGALLLDNGGRAEIAGFLRPEHFAYVAHARIYEAIGRLNARQIIADPITLKAAFERDGGLQETGGADYLRQLAKSTVTLRNARGYARAIVDAWQRRELVKSAEEGIAGALTGNDEASELIERQRGNLIRIAESGRASAPPAIIHPAGLQGKPIPERREIISEWIPWNAVTGLSGLGGVGKSLLAQQLLTSAATGVPWLGLRVARVRSLYFACEDSADELHRRQALINEAYGCQFADLADTRWMARNGHDNLLMTFPGGVPTCTVAFDELLREARSHRAQLVVVDTAADTFGGNENDRGQVRQFVQACLGRLAREIDGAVVLLSHPSRSGQSDGSGQSGSTGWDASFRARLYLAPPKAGGDGSPDGDRRELTRRKANYARREDRIELRWTNGVFEVVEQPNRAGIFGAAHRQHVEHVFLALLDQTTGQSRSVSVKPRAGNYAPRVFAEMPGREGCGVADFKQAMERLFATGKIINRQYGSPSAQHFRIEPLPSDRSALC